MKKLSIVLLLSLLVISCGGDNGSGTPDGEAPPTLFQPGSGDDGLLPVPDTWTLAGVANDESVKTYVFEPTIRVQETTGYIIYSFILVSTEEISRQLGLFPVVWIEGIKRADCDRDREGLLSAYNRDKNGNVVSWGTDPNPPWEPVIPNTINEGVFMFVCDG